MRTMRLLFSLLVLLVASPSSGDWKDIVGIKSDEATQKVEDRAGNEVDKKVDSTVDCVFNPIECSRKMKPSEEAETTKSSDAEAKSSDMGSKPPPPPSATRSKTGPPPPPSARTWHVDIGGGQTREVGESELIGMIGRGEIDRSTPVWTESFGGEFEPAGDVTQLERHFGSD